MNYNVRINDNFLRGDHVDGEVLQHTDLNELESVAKTAINANYEDIQKLQDGTTVVKNSEQLDGASLSKFATETLQNSDTKVPTSSQVKQYVDGAISGIDLDGYYTKRETDDLLDEKVDKVDGKQLSTEDYTTSEKSKLSGIEANADVNIIETVKVDGTSLVPDGNKAVNVDLSGKVDKVIGKGLSTNDYTNDEKNKLSGIETGAQVNKIETIKVNGTNQEISSKSVNITVPTKTSDLTNDSDYVKNADYAIASKAGVIKSGYNGLQVDSTNGKTYCDIYTYANYGNVENQRFISKGTLENVITGKGLVSNTDYATTNVGGVIKAQAYYGLQVSAGSLLGVPRTYEQYSSSSYMDNNSIICKGTLENVLDNRIGDIDSVLDAINGEVI